MLTAEPIEWSRSSICCFSEPPLGADINVEIWKINEISWTNIEYQILKSFSSTKEWRNHKMSCEILPPSCTCTRPLMKWNKLPVWSNLVDEDDLANTQRELETHSAIAWWVMRRRQVMLIRSYYKENGQHIDIIDSNTQTLSICDCIAFKNHIDQCVLELIIVTLWHFVFSCCHLWTLFTFWHLCSFDTQEEIIWQFIERCGNFIEFLFYNHFCTFWDRMLFFSPAKNHCVIKKAKLNVFMGLRPIARS